MIRALLLALALMLPAQAWAVQPDEVMDDPLLEERAREISKGLRCPVCQNESIDESNANIARDLRLLVRDRLEEGDTDKEVVDFIVARYGEFVLLRPTIDGSNWMLWAAGPFMLVLAVFLGFVYVRGREKATAPHEEALSAEERARLEQILKE